MIFLIAGAGLVAGIYWAIFTGGLSNLKGAAHKAVPFKDMTEEERKQTMEAMKNE